MLGKKKKTPQQSILGMSYGESGVLRMRGTEALVAGYGAEHR